MTHSAGGSRGEERPDYADSAQPEAEATWTTASQADLEALLNGYADLRNQIAKLESAREAVAKLLRPWLEANPGQELHDGEHGWRAYLQPRRGARPYDLTAIRRDDPSLMRQLLDNGCLMVDAKTVKAKGALVAGIERYAGLEPVSYSLQVEKTT